MKSRPALLCLLMLGACKTTAPKPTAAPSPAAASADSTGGPLPPAAGPHQVGNREREAFNRAVELGKTNTGAAEAALRALVTRDPRLDYAWTNLGILCEREARVDCARDAYEHALQVQPEQADAWEYLTRLDCREGQCAQAESRLRAKLQQTPGALSVRTALVYTLVQQKKLEAAATEAKKVLKADERNVRAMQLLAQVYYREQKFELAKMVLENARANNPTDALTFNALGLVQVGLKMKPAALESFRQAATLKPDFAEARNNYGMMLNESQDYDGAIRELEAAVLAAPDFVSAQLNLGNAYRGRQDFAKALAAYGRAQKLKPALADTYFNLGVLHLDSPLLNLDTVERLKAAIAYFRQYKEKGGTDERLDQYVKDANKGIEKEGRRQERERKEGLKKQSLKSSVKVAPAKTKTKTKAKPVSPGGKVDDAKN